VTLELSALHIPIRDVGADATLAKIRQVDQAATQTGKKSVAIPVTIPGADVAKRGLEGLATQTSGLHNKPVVIPTSAPGVEPTTRLMRGLGLAIRDIGKAGNTAGLDAITQRIGLFSAGAQIASTRAASLQRLAQLEGTLRQQLAAGNLTLAQRIQLEQQLARVVASQAAAQPAAPAAVPVIGTGRGLAATLDQIGRAGTGGLEAVTRRITMLSEGLQIASTRAASLSRLVGIEHSLRTALQAGNLTLQQRIALEQQLARVQAARRSVEPAAPAAQPTVVGGIAARLGGSLSGFGRTAAATAAGMVAGGAITAGVTTLLGVIPSATQAVNDLETAQRRLLATSKLTGVAHDTLVKSARTAQQDFKLNAGVAAEYSARLATLGQKAGDAAVGLGSMQAWLDIGAARGLDAAETLTALQQAILGIDEGTDKLFGKNPSSIYAEFAAQIGTTAGKLTDAQKAQAILNIAQRDGAKVTGEYARFLQSARGQQSAATAETQRFREELGKLVQPGVQVWNTMKSAAAGAIADILGAMNRFPEQVAERIRRIGPAAQQAAAGLGLAVGMAAAPTTAGAFVPQGPPNPNTTRPAITVTASQQTEQERIAEALRGLERERQAILTQQVASLTAIFELRKATLGDVQAAQRLEATLSAELAKGTASLERRVELEQQLRALRGSGVTLGRPDVVGIEDPWERLARTPRAKIKIPATLSPLTIEPAPLSAVEQEIGRLFDELEADGSAAAKAIATTLADELAAIEKRKLNISATVTVTTESAGAASGEKPEDDAKREAARKAADAKRSLDAVSAQLAQSAASAGVLVGEALGTAISGGTESAGKALLAGLGGILVDMGRVMIAASPLIAGIRKALLSLNPAVALAAGIGLVAIGTALRNAASGEGSNGRVAGAGSVAGAGVAATAGPSESRIAVGDNRPSVAGSAASAAVPRGSLTAATPAQPTVINLQLWNPNDPAVHRLLASTLRLVNGRGLATT
jgi:hypothetical protein